MPETQLEIPFEAAVQAALADPETASLETLWAELEPSLQRLSDEDQLQVAGQAISQCAQVLEAKANAWFAAWNTALQDGRLQNAPSLATEPILTDAMLSGVLRQSMSLNLEDILQAPPRSRSSTDEPILTPNSIVAEMDQATLLTLIDETMTHRDASLTQALAVAHEENIAAWAGAIAQYLNHQSRSSICLSELRQAIPLSLIELWLGLLLGGYHLTSDLAGSTASEPQMEWSSSDQDFYHREIWIQRPSTITA
jgi:hypothetical protein